MPALNRTEAETRARLIDVHHYTIDLDLTRGAEVFGSTTEITFTALAAGDTFVEVKPDTLHRVVLDGRELDPRDLDDNRLPLTLAAGEHRLLVEADMRYSRTGEGLHRFTDPADGLTYAYTQLFMEDVQRVTAAFDQPDLKAVFDVTATAPAEWTVLGNGISERIPDGEGRWRISTTPPISTYLLAVAAGPWHSVRTEHAGLPFALHCRRSLAPHLDADADELFDITRRCFDRYRELFTEPYPFDSYEQAFVPEFNSGAMENPGLVTFREEFVFRSAVTDTERQTRGMVIAHEMAHMWFGDLVTLRWWDDIWLNESFAEYMGFQVLSEATGFTGTWTDFAVARKGWGYDADQRPSTHPVAPDAEAVPDTASALLNFDGISYAKGASALRQLVAWIGEKDFLAGINDHFARHRFGNATLADFLDSLARSTDRDVHAWAAQWLRTSGVDTLEPVVADHPGGWQLEIRHTGSRPHRIDIGLYDRAPADPARLVPRDRVRTDLTGTAAPQPLTLPGRRPDLVLLNDGDLSFAKIRFDQRSWTTVAEALGGLPDALSRAVAWNAARDLVRDGLLHPAAYLDAARTQLPREDDLAIVQGVLGFARTHVADRYLPADQRPAALATLSALARDLLHSPADGLRLAAVRSLIGSSDDTAELRDWLTADRIPGGPALDPELRWRLLLRLAVLGRADGDDIAAELVRDPSASGEESAARCRAALPDPQAKESAWAALFDDDTLSNYLFNATAQGFWQPEQHDLLRDYLPRYYPAAVTLAARRGPALAEAAGRHAFPAYAVRPDTLRLGRECLRSDEPTPALRRMLADQLDDLDRALRVHAAAAETAPTR
ncbi:aminopeptidase N [Peterkaempfera bronchialis]|uniref:Aminopeptidase N n=1 Tax=Peterkaempfera bronchialis TaxID=2126346 RepID=A0A345SRL8_9ACTN|nr:aminopeptidase N [Peterkaempfera bronchialis]AXI76373.1 aminopeptidase N [Peterkaempfera bronchialis]